MSSERVIYVDASPYIFRAFFSMPSSLKDPTGAPVGAVYGFAGFLLKLFEQERPSHVALAFDRSLTTSFRNEIYPPYKAQRELPPAELEAQINLCEDVGRALGCATFSDERYEADDLIATLCDRLEREGHDGLVVTSDKDLCQLVSSRVELLDFAKDLRFGPAEVVDKMGVEPRQVADFLGLAGDSVDNIPGVKGVGAKTASALLGHFADLDALFADLDAVPALPIRGAKALRNRLETGREDAFLSRRLATVARDAPVEAGLEELAVGPVDEALVSALVERLGAAKLGDRLRARV